MCILCGEFVEQIHWTDMELKQLSMTTTGERQRDRKRTRDKRVKICNQLFEYYGLSLKEWQNKYMIQNRTGKMEVVYDLGEIWQSAEKMLGKPIDPLDLRLIKSLSSSVQEVRDGE